MINIENLPGNFKNFMDFFSSNVFDMVPNFVEVDEESPEASSESPKFLRRFLEDKTTDTIEKQKDSNSKGNRFCHIHQKF